MASVLETLTKKLEVLGGRIYEEHLFEPENLIAIWTLDDPRVYKPVFNLDNKGGLGIEKTLKSFLFEVKDSLCTLYYILDSACLSLDFSCKYQLRETISEVPLSLITYLRVLCSKKAPIEISIDDNFIYIVFENSIVKGDKQSIEPKPKLKKGEKREKEVGKKYVLELPLPIHNTDSLDLAVIELVKNLDIGEQQPSEPIELSADVSTLKYSDGSGLVELHYAKVPNSYGDLKIVYVEGLPVQLIQCPMEIARHYEKEDVVYTSSFEANDYTEKYLIPEDADVDYEEDMQHLNDVADMIDAFMIGEENDTN